MSVSLNIKPCRVCGTWVCHRCGWRRTMANRHAEQRFLKCFKCEGTDGHFEDVRHSSRATREDHEFLADSRGWR